MDSISNKQKQPEKRQAAEIQDAQKAMEVIDSLPEKQKREVMQAMCTIQQTSFHGPLPPPEMMEGYEAILPGAAERIMKMAENQSAHRMNMESVSMHNQIKLKKSGQILGFIMALIIIGLSVWLGIEGHDVLAGVIGSTTVIALAIVFVLGKVPKGQKNV